MSSTFLIEPTMTLNELVAYKPNLLPLLRSFGLDTCCGGSLSLAVAAEHHKLDLHELVQILERAVQPVDHYAITTRAE